MTPDDVQFVWDTTFVRLAMAKRSGTVTMLVSEDGHVWDDWVYGPARAVTVKCAPGPWSERRLRVAIAAEWNSIQ